MKIVAFVALACTSHRRRLANDELFIDFGGAGKVPLIPLSDRLFSGAGVRARFESDDTGKVTQLVAEIVEAEIKGKRK